ncbi:MAG: sugar ABC transporter substrate-binding protein [Oscillospiraceae bacterium]|jgi:ABC-type glycerol-3-phosphate transport system substrate-binding protein|nr:sugar ABC transporter substrate-binding protein [Oscillospiraceae bacterium]
MKTRIRFLALAAVLCMLLAACSSNSASPAAPGNTGSGAGADPSPAADSPNPAAPTELDEIPSDVIDANLTCEISLGNYPADTAKAEEIAVVDGYIAIMKKQYPNVTVTPDYFSYTLDTYIGRALGGTAPTIFQPPFTDPPLLIQQGIAGDITEALEEIDLLKDFSPAYLEMLSDENGRIYGLPRDGYVMGLHLNLNLFEQAGLMNEDGTVQYPKTLQELAETGRIIKEKTGKAGLVFPASDTYGGWLFTNIAWNFGAVGDNAMQYQDENGKWIVNLTSDACVAALEYVKSLRWEYDILNADTTTSTWASCHTALGSGEAAMNIAADDSTAEPTAGAGLAVDKFALVPYPAGPAGAYALKGGTAYMFAPGITVDQGKAALAYLKIAGLLPYADDAAIAAMKAGAAGKRDRGAPVIPPVPAWNNEAFVQAQKDIAAEYSNVDIRLYEDYLNSLTDGSISLRGEEPIYTQDFYRELTGAVQLMIVREDSNARSALEKAQNNFQAYLDDQLGQ